MKEILDFTARFKVTISLNEKLVVKRKKRYFLLDENLKSHLHEDYYYIGFYLGKIKGGKFFPSFNLLAMMARGRARKIVVNRKTEWLFICGRDIFKRGMLRTTDSMRKGDYTLVVNRYGECLGYGRVLCNVDEEVDKQKVIVRNISDIGDFLRRER